MWPTGGPTGEIKVDTPSPAPRAPATAQKAAPATEYKIIIRKKVVLATQAVPPLLVCDRYRYAETRRTGG